MAQSDETVMFTVSYDHSTNEVVTRTPSGTELSRVASPNKEEINIVEAAQLASDTLSKWYN